GVGGLALAAYLVLPWSRRDLFFIDPHYRDILRRERLADFEHLHQLPGVIIGGHPDRHVAQVTLGTGAQAIRAVLKREHRVPWKDRLANAWAGFGFVSKSYREALLLRSLRRAGIGCSEVIATGEDRHGHAF